MRADFTFDSHFLAAIDSPDFYCHGDQCIRGDCSSLFCADNPEVIEDEEPW